MNEKFPGEISIIDKRTLEEKKETPAVEIILLEREMEDLKKELISSGGGKKEKGSKSEEIKGDLGQKRKDLNNRTKEIKAKIGELEKSGKVNETPAEEEVFEPILSEETEEKKPVEEPESELETGDEISAEEAQESILKRALKGMLRGEIKEVIEPEIAQEKVDGKIPEQEIPEREEKGREELEQKLLQVDKLLSLYKDRGRFLFHLENLKGSGANENEIANAQTKISEINYNITNLCRVIKKSEIEGFPENEKRKVEEIMRAVEEGKMDYGKLEVIGKKKYTIDEKIEQEEKKSIDEQLKNIPNAEDFENYIKKETKPQAPQAEEFVEAGIEKEGVPKNIKEVLQKFKDYEWSLQERIVEIAEENKGKLEDYDMGKEQSEEDKKAVEEIIKLKNMGKTAALDKFGAEIAASSFEVNSKKRMEAAEAVSKDLGNLIQTLQGEILKQQIESNRREPGGEKNKLIRNFAGASEKEIIRTVSKKSEEQAEKPEKGGLWKKLQNLKNKLIKKTEEKVSDNSAKAETVPENQEESKEFKKAVAVAFLETLSAEQQKQFPDKIEKLGGEMRIGSEEQIKKMINKLPDEFKNEDIEELKKKIGEISFKKEDFKELVKKEKESEVDIVPEDGEKGKGKGTGEITEDMKERMKEAISDLDNNDFEHYGKVIESISNHDIEKNIKGKPVENFISKVTLKEITNIDIEELKDINAEDFMAVLKEIYEEVKEGKGEAGGNKEKEEVTKDDIEKEINAFLEKDELNIENIGNLGGLEKLLVSLETETRNIMKKEIPEELTYGLKTIISKIEKNHFTWYLEEGLGIDSKTIEGNFSEDRKLAEDFKIDSLREYYLELLDEIEKLHNKIYGKEDVKIKVEDSYNVEKKKLEKKKVEKSESEMDSVIKNLDENELKSLWNFFVKMPQESRINDLFGEGRLRKEAFENITDGKINFEDIKNLKAKEINKKIDAQIKQMLKK